MEFNTNMKKMFGKRLRELRTSKMLTQETVAELIDIKPENYSRIENGLSFPKPENIVKISKVLNVEIAELFQFSHLNDYDKILEYAKVNLPEEACGLIGGTIEDGNKYIKKVYLLTNIDHSNEHFSMDPKEQLAAVKDMRAEGLVPLGNWHSHPESPSRPSEEDKRLAYDSKASYMILSLMNADEPVLNSFHIEGNVSEKEDLHII